MELWNENDEFRKEYIRCNTRSTLRRLRTLDGRSLGPDEEPPLIPNVVKERVAMGNTLSLPSLQPEKHIVQVETVEVKGKVVPDAVEQKKQTTKSKKPVKLSPLGNGLATVSGRDEIEEVREEEPKLTKQEEELARKREELRREEEATKSREQQLLEEKVKAKEALERKKRNAEKAHAKAMLRAQKEAEEKEKVNSTDVPKSVTLIGIIHIHMPLFFASLLTWYDVWSLCRKGRKKQGRRKERRRVQ